MTPLALTLPPAPQETPTSYLSRLAARNLYDDMESFAQDVGLDVPAIACGAEPAIMRLCALAGLPEDSFARQTVIKTSTMKYRLGGEVLNTETLARGELRFCPFCVAEALQRGEPIWSVVHPLHWQIIPIRACIEHGTKLQSNRPNSQRVARLDFTAMVREMDWNGGNVDNAEPADALDRYLTQRIYGQHQRNWCDSLEIPALVKACEAFGVLMVFGREARASTIAPAPRRDAIQEGFQILSAGREGIWEALDSYNTRTPTRGGNQPHPSYGELQRLLGSHAKARRDLEPLRAIVREYFLDHYPFKPGTVVLGQRIAETRVFSMRGACRQIAVRRSLLEEILIRRGVGNRDGSGAFVLSCPLTRKMVEDLRREHRDYLNQTETAAALGCSFAMFKQLQRAGIIRPEDGDGRWRRKGYHRPTLVTLLTRLAGKARRTPKPNPDWCTFELATRKANCSVPQIVQLILDGKVVVRACLTEELRLDTLLVDASDVVAALREDVEPNGYSLRDVSQRLGVCVRTVRRMVDQRQLTVRRMRHNITRVTRAYITPESLAEVEAKRCWRDPQPNANAR